MHCDNKRNTHIQVFRHFLSSVGYQGKDEDKLIYDPSVVFEFDAACYQKDLIAP